MYLKDLEVEVTESATLLGHQRDAVLGTLRRLQAAGARIAMDDFGTGHSSLSNLKDFGFDKAELALCGCAQRGLLALWTKVFDVF